MQIKTTFLYNCNFRQSIYNLKRYIPSLLSLYIPYSSPPIPYHPLDETAEAAA